MPSFYSVVQYLPDPVRDERINIGVIAYDDARVQCRFLKAWERVKCFAAGEAETKFFLNVVQDIESACYGPGRLGRSPRENYLDAKAVQSISSRWNQSIQITEPRGSTRPLHELLPFVANRFLVQNRQRTMQIEYRAPSQAKTLIIRDVTAPILQRYGTEGRALIQKDFRLMGLSSLLPHRFDVSLAQESPYVLFQSHTFEGTESNEKESSRQATQYAVSDVRAFEKEHKQPATPMAVMVLPPQKRAPASVTTTYDEFCRFLKRNGADILMEHEVSKYVVSIAEKALPDSYRDLAPTPSRSISALPT